MNKWSQSTEIVRSRLVRPGVWWTLLVTAEYLKNILGTKSTTEDQPALT